MMKMQARYLNSHLPSSFGSELETESYSRLEGGGGGFMFRLSG